MPVWLPLLLRWPALPPPSLLYTTVAAINPAFGAVEVCLAGVEVALGLTSQRIPAQGR
jgi:hypothetical protein